MMKLRRPIILEGIKRRVGFQNNSIYNRVTEVMFSRLVPLGARAAAWMGVNQW